LKHRTTAIHGSKIPIPSYPETLRLYKIPASAFFQVKARVNGVRVKRSTKTENLSEAIAFAKAFYNELLVKAAQKQPLVESKNFEKVVESLIAEDQGRVDRSERSEHLVRDAKSIFRELIRFFKTYHVRDIGYDQIQQFIASKKDIKTNTLKNYLIFLRKALKHAHKKGLLDKLPIFPTLTIKANPRGWFTTEQYRKLRDSIKACEGQTAKKTHIPIGRELGLLTTFLVNTFLRPPDIKNLRNRDIEIVDTADQKFLRIRAASKVVPAPVISMANGVDIYRQLLALHKGVDGPDDFVFFPQFKNRAYAFQTMRLQFNHVLQKAGLKFSGAVPRTLYSLRHTAIMFRLTKGENLDLLTLAKNCRTSVEMLEKFYASHLTPEMNVQKLQRFRRRRKSSQDQKSTGT
jgi:integrase